MIMLFLIFGEKNIYIPRTIFLKIILLFFTFFLTTIKKLNNFFFLTTILVVIVVTRIIIIVVVIVLFPHRHHYLLKILSPIITIPISLISPSPTLLIHLRFLLNTKN